MEYGVWWMEPLDSIRLYIGCLTYWTDRNSNFNVFPDMVEEGILRDPKDPKDSG